MQIDPPLTEDEAAALLLPPARAIATDVTEEQLARAAAPIAKAMAALSAIDLVE